MKTQQAHTDYFRFCGFHSAIKFKINYQLNDQLTKSFGKYKIRNVYYKQICVGICIGMCNYVLLYCSHIVKMSIKYLM